jgi:hypothetical protein
MFTAKRQRLSMLFYILMEELATISIVCPVVLFLLAIALSVL